MKNFIQEIWNSHKSKQNEKKEKEILDTYNIIEKNHTIYIIVKVGLESRVLRKVLPNESAESIVKSLHSYRSDALQYNKK